MRMLGSHSLLILNSCHFSLNPMSMLGTKLQPMNISNHGLSLAFILTFINQYFQGAEGKRMMGKSKNNPQPNQIGGH